MTIEFQSFNKIARLSRECIITEKIDGTNAQILIGEDGEFLTGSRTRWITPDNDNFGFSQWAHEHKDELLTLGPGRHFGEWWGKGIQRAYGLDERRWSLFNTDRWTDETRPTCCHVVPTILRGDFDTDLVWAALRSLEVRGSAAAPGFMDPEGVVVFHTVGNLCFKKTLGDDDGKFKKAKKERPEAPPHELQIMWTGGRRKGATAGYIGSERRTPK